MEPIKILIADDHSLFRGIVRDFLSSIATVSVVGEAVDGLDVVQKVEDLDPDVILMDIKMPNRDGLEATRLIKQRWPSKIVVITTMHEDDAYRIRARELGADGFILKSAMKPRLQEAFREGSSIADWVHSSGDGDRSAARKL
ncbi:MAG: response regulator transcription factor [Ignavibacteria bacterium]|nr:response regulator transcription factor [Ignavibacteria bacterium]